MSCRETVLEHLRDELIKMTPDYPATALNQVYIKPDDIDSSSSFDVPFGIVKLQPLTEFSERSIGCYRGSTVAEIYIYVSDGVAAFGEVEDVESEKKAREYAKCVRSIFKSDSSFDNGTIPTGQEIKMQDEINVPFEWNRDPYSIYYAAFPIKLKD